MQRGEYIKTVLAAGIIGGLCGAAGTAGAVEPGFKEMQVNSGYKIIADEDMEIRQTGGHIVIEDLSTANSKKIRRLQDEVAKLRSENKQLRDDLKQVEARLQKQLAAVQADLDALLAEIRSWQ